ncbi:MAG: GntR family transcriptional regulator [Limnochordia bacterium]|jgi:GntR family transcriptional regulator
MHDLKIRESREPLYITVAKRLREEIGEGVFKGEDRLPSEEKLAQLFGVSRTTVREALSALEKEGLLKRVHGVGTWITHNKRVPIGTGMERITSYTEYMRKFGYDPGTKLAHFEWVPASPKHKQDFERDLDRVGVLTRVRTANGEPLMLAYDVMPPEVIGEGFRVEQLGESLFAYLEEHGLRLRYSEMDITAVTADAELARLLEVEVGVPLLRMDDRYFDYQGNIVLWTRNIYRVDRWTLKMVIDSGE